MNFFILRDKETVICKVTQVQLYVVPLLEPSEPRIDFDVLES